MRIPKMCLKQSFSYSKWVLQTILFLTVLLNCETTISTLNNSKTVKVTKKLQETKNIPSQLLNPTP